MKRNNWIERREFEEDISLIENSIIDFLAATKAYHIAENTSIFYGIPNILDLEVERLIDNKNIVEKELIKKYLREGLNENKKISTYGGLLNKKIKPRIVDVRYVDEESLVHLPKNITTHFYGAFLKKYFGNEISNCCKKKMNFKEISTKLNLKNKLNLNQNYLNHSLSKTIYGSEYGYILRTFEGISEDIINILAENSYVQSNQLNKNNLEAVMENI